jgi:hypothetical protein
MADESNGGAARGPAEEIDLTDPAVATQFANLGMIAERYLEMFAPQIRAKLTPEQFQALILGMLREERMISEQIRPLFAPDVAKETPEIILQLSIPGQQAVNFQAKRRIELCTNPAEVFAQAFVIAFTDSPGMRSVFRAHGWQYMWLSPKPKGRIILAKV